MLYDVNVYVKKTRIILPKPQKVIYDLLKIAVYLINVVLYDNTK